MAKKSAIMRNLKRERLAKRYMQRRLKLKAIARDKEKPFEERMDAQRKLSELPRNSAPTRYRNRCLVTGRPRGYDRMYKMSRIALREYALAGVIPGVVKSSW